MSAPQLVKLRTEEEEQTKAPVVPYILITPGHHPARTGKGYQVLGTWADIDPVCSSASKSEYLAVDFETRGGDYSDPSMEVIGIGLAWDRGSVYFHWPELYAKSKSALVALLNAHKGLIAHNIYFDGGVATEIVGAEPKWHACTYSLLAYLANESKLRKWGLKHAQVELLGWESKGDVDLDEWLVSNKYYKGNRRINEDPQHLLECHRRGELSPEKGEMWRAPKAILGKYCALDAESCYLLYTQVLLPAAHNYPGLLKFFHEDLMPVTDLLIRQKVIGMEIDRPGMIARKAVLESEITKATEAFLTNDRVVPVIRKLDEELLLPLIAKEPVKYNKPKKNDPEGGVISKNWVKWEERLRLARDGQLPEYKFNPNSGDQMRKLLYADGLGYPVRILTDKGLPATGTKAYKHMGEIGKILVDRAYMQKELSYIDSYLGLTEVRPTIHPSFRVPGTITGRLSGKEPNLQQIPKSSVIMDLFTARPGHVWIDLDFSALEPTVATEFSGDPNMLAIYGEGRPKNDIYLFVAATVPIFRERVLATGYDPYNPTPETLARAKKECKHERGICKTVVLACQYGAGVNKVMSTLEADDIFLEYEEVKAVHSGYWETFSVLKEFSKELYWQWVENGGYILNGMQRPMAVPEDFNKDLLNRFVQSTGHDILVKYIRIFTSELDRREIPWEPVVIDWHDSSAIEVPEEFKDRAIEVYLWGLEELNNQLGGNIKLRGTPSYGTTMSSIKEPES